MEVSNKILGSIVGAALGDAMGAITETRSAERIKKDFGHYIDDLQIPPSDCFARGYPIGSVTDDFSLAYFTGYGLIKCHGNVTPDIAKEVVLEWANYPKFFHFAGPTTEAAVRALRGEEISDPKDYIACNNMRGTNGGGMKIFCAGLINPGNVDKAVHDAAVLCMPTHSNTASISGAAAIAAAVATAMTANAKLSDVIDAGIEGAHKGYDYGNKYGTQLAVPSVEKRIRLAVEIAEKKRTEGWEMVMLELRDIIGAGLNAFEAIPCAFGIVAACPNDAFSAIKMGVNIGDDTDTVATMVGAIVGALYGMSNIPEKFIDVIDKANGFDLRNFAKEIEENFYA